MKSHKMVLLGVLSVLLYTGCTKGIDNPVPLEKNQEKYTSLYFKSEEYPSENFLVMEDVIVNENNLYEFGYKVISEDEGKCTVCSLDNTYEIKVESCLQYDGIWGACISHNKIYVVYLRDDKNYLSCIDIESGKTEKSVVIDCFPQSVMCTDNSVVIMSDDFNSREVLLYRYDLNLELQPLINLSSLTDKDGFYGNCFRMTWYNGEYYFFGKHTNGLLYLYCMNEEMCVKYSKEIDDMPGYADNIFFENDHLTLNSYSYDDSCIFIDYVDSSDGEIRERYEIPDADNVLAGYSDEIKLCSKETNYFYYDIKEKRRVETDVSECISSGSYCYLTENGYITFPDMLSQIHTVCEKYDTNHNIVSETDFGTSVIDYTLNKDEMYVLSYYDESYYELSIYDENNNVRSVKIEKDYDRDCKDLLVAGNYVFMTMIGYDNSCEVVRYDLNGNREESVYSSRNYIDSVFESHDNVYFSVSDKKGNIDVMIIKDNTVYDLTALSGTDISHIYCGDDQYDLYYESGSSLYGYKETEEKSDRIIDLVDSELIYSIDSFRKIADNSYFCLMTSNSDVFCLKLQKADDEEIDRLNNRKKIILAGDNIKDNFVLSEAILQFNHENLDYYITTRDYASDDSLISGIGQDVVKSDIPDIYVFDNNSDLLMLSEKNALFDLTELIEKDPDTDISDYFVSVLKSEPDDGIYRIVPEFKLGVMVFGGFSESEPVSYNYSEFLQLIKNNKIQYKFALEDAIVENLIVSRAYDFIDFKNSKCSFDTDEFKELLKYSSEAVGKTGTAGIHEIYDFASVCSLDALYNNNYTIAEVSADGNGKAYVDISDSFGFSVLSVSENPDGAWQFIKRFLCEDYQDNTNDFPVLKSSFEKKFSEEIKLNGHTASIYTSDSETPVKYTINITENDKKLISDLINSPSHINSVDKKIESIIRENMDLYKEKVQTADETAKNIQNKVSLYISEIKN